MKTDRFLKKYAHRKHLNQWEYESFLKNVPHTFMENESKSKWPHLRIFENEKTNEFISICEGDINYGKIK